MDGGSGGSDREVDFLRSGKSAEAEAEAGAGEVFGKAERSQDVAGLRVGAGAGTAAGDGDVLHVDEQGFAIDEGEGTVEVARETDELVRTGWLLIPLGPIE